MVIKQNVAFGIVGGISQFWKCKDFQDFTVIVGDVQFECHRFLLAACSDFFRGLFRSGMQETGQKSVTIKDVSTETFELIFESIYTGRDVLTNDNVTEIWEAADQLQINFLVSECENFVLETLSLENYADYFHTCVTLNSGAVLETVWSFILKNCNSFFQTDYFLDLPMAHVLSLIKRQDLGTKSEDDVILAILKWAEFSCVRERGDTFSSRTIQNEDNKSCVGDEYSQITRNSTDTDIIDLPTVMKNLEKNVPNDTFDNQGEYPNKEDRDKSLFILLSHTRMCLASQECLEMLAKHPLAKNNKGINDIVIDALFYKLQVRKRNGQWPSRAVHRDNSDFINCLVNAQQIGKDVLLTAYSLTRNKWLKLPSLHNFNGSMKLAAVGQELYVIVTMKTANVLVYFQLKKRKWSEVNLCVSLRLDNFRVAVVDSFIHIFSLKDRAVWRLEPTSKKIAKISNFTGQEDISYVMPYDQWILVFYVTEGMDETVVHCYDTLLNTWSKLNSLQGPANGMTSFKDDHFTYILQTNGNMWKVVKPQANIFDFEYVAKLWTCNWPLYGAVTFMDELYIQGAEPDVLCDDPYLQRSLPGVFSAINYLGSSFNETAMSIPTTLDRKNLV